MNSVYWKLKRKWKKSGKVKGVALASFFLLLFFLCASIACDFGYKKPHVLYIFLLVKPESKDNIVAAFNTLWSVAVTVTIFVLEISEKYKYGVPLKRIVVEALGNGWLFVGVAVFLLLFPVFYICMKFSFMQMGLWCLCTAFIMFTETVAFFAWMYKGQHIRDVVGMKTMEQIADLAKREEGVKVQTIRLHVQIDGMAISDMLDHTDYGNADEVGGLVGLCKDIFGDLEFWDKLYKSTLENLMIITWVDHIIHSCKWNTEYDCIQNVNTLCLLWKEITDTISINRINESKTSLKRKKCDHIIGDYDEVVISVCLQFLQSFVNENNMENDRILVRVWRRFGIYRKQTLVYLLLYTTYLEYRYELIDYSWILREEFEFRVCMREIIQGYFWWDEHFAVKCWIDWSRYDCHEDIDLTKFMQFSSDMKSLQDGKRYRVKSPILIRVVGGIE